MKKYFAIAFLLLFLAGMGTTVRAQEGAIVVTVPFEFVAGGKTLPAGKYTIGPVSSESDNTLKIYNESGDGSTLFLAATFDGSSDFDNLRLGFEHGNGTYFLSRVTTSSGTYTLNTRPEMPRLAQAQKHDSTAPSGTN